MSNHLDTGFGGGRLVVLFALFTNLIVFLSAAAPTLSHSLQVATTSPPIMDFDPVEHLHPVSFDHLKYVHDILDFENHVATLMPGQLKFITALANWFHFQEHLFVLVSGGPGSGKTHTVIKTLQHFKKNILIMAPTARLANQIGGQTIHSTMNLACDPDSPLNQIEKRLLNIDNINECVAISSQLQDEMNCNRANVDIVVLDEGDRLPFWLLYQIVYKFFQRRHPILFVCIGYLQPRQEVRSRSNLFRTPFDKYFKTVRIEINESVRFRKDYQDFVSNLKRIVYRFSYTNLNEICELSPPKALQLDYIGETWYPLAFRNLLEMNCVTVLAFLVKGLLNEATRVFAYTNETVETCNRYYIDEKLKNNKEFILYRYGHTAQLNREKGTRLRQFCDVVVTENGCGSVSKGTLLQFIHYDPQSDVAVCLDEHKQELVIHRSATTRQIPIVPGFAMLMEQFQGDMIDDDKIIFSFDQCRDFSIISTALCRVQSMFQISAIIL